MGRYVERQKTPPTVSNEGAGEVAGLMVFLAAVVLIVKGIKLGINKLKAMISISHPKQVPVVKTGVSVLTDIETRLKRIEGKLNSKEELTSKTIKLNSGLFTKADNATELVYQAMQNRQQLNKFLSIAIPVANRLNKLSEDYDNDKFDESDLDDRIDKECVKYQAAFVKTFSNKSVVEFNGYHIHKQDTSVIADYRTPATRLSEIESPKKAQIDAILKEINQYVALYTTCITARYAEYAQKETEWVLIYPKAIYTQLDTLLKVVEDSIT